MMGLLLLMAAVVLAVEFWWWADVRKHEKRSREILSEAKELHAQVFQLELYQAMRRQRHIEREFRQ